MCINYFLPRICASLLLLTWPMMLVLCTCSPNFLYVLILLIIYVITVTTYCSLLHKNVRPYIYSLWFYANVCVFKHLHSIRLSLCSHSHVFVSFSMTVRVLNVTCCIVCICHILTDLAYFSFLKPPSTDIFYQ